jgi:hypothetical protein
MFQNVNAPIYSKIQPIFLNPKTKEASTMKLMDDHKMELKKICLFLRKNAGRKKVCLALPMGIN